MRTLAFILFLLLQSTLLAQSGDSLIRSMHLQALRLIDSTKYQAVITSWPIVRDTLDRYPNRMEISGKVVDYSKGTSCGVLCGCGAMLVVLDTPIPNYPHDSVYIAVPCMNYEPKRIFKGKVEEIKMNDDSCFWWETPINKFDSKGIPFYRPRE